MDPSKKYKNFLDGSNPHDFEVREIGKGSYGLYIHNAHYTVTSADGKQVTDQLNLQALIELMKTPDLKIKDSFNMKIANTVFTFKKV